MPTHDHAPRTPRLLPLWFAFLGPPLIWAARFGVNYVLLPYTCAHDAALLLHIITLVALLGIGWAAVVAWKIRRARDGMEPVELGGMEARARFMALAGLLGSGIFFAAIVAEGVAVFIIDPCQTGGVPL